MGGFFNPDNAFFSFMGKVFDMVVINTIWLFLCLPLPALTISWAAQTGVYALLILTFLTLLPIVPATTAMYYTIVKVIRRERSYAIKEFFRSFRRNFKQGLAFSVIALAAIGILYIDFTYAMDLSKAGESSGSTFMGVFLVVAFLVTSVYMYVCPVLSRFEMRLGRMLKTCFYMATRHILTTVLLIVIAAVVLLGCYLVLPGIFILPVCATLLASFLMERVFKRYMPAKQETQESEEVQESVTEDGTEEKKDEWYLE